MLTENVSLAVGISRAEAGLRKRLDGPLGGGHGLGFTDFQILTELDAVQGGRLRSGDLAARLMLTPSGVTRAVLPLEKIGLLQRQPDERDARATYICLTDAGRERVTQASETVERVVAQALDALTRSDRLTLLGVFERLGY